MGSLGAELVVISPAVTMSNPVTSEHCCGGPWSTLTQLVNKAILLPTLALP